MANFLNNIFGAGAQGALSGQYEKHMQHLRAQEDLERLRTENQLANQYAQNLGQSMMNAKTLASQNVYSQALKPFNPNEIEAYKIPLSQLVTLWQAKFGDEWVSYDQLKEDFWHEAGSRLYDSGKLEKAKADWFRIKEDA